MLCPSCGDEFREGIAACPDCEIALVDALPPEAPLRLVILESTDDPDRLAVLLEKLETALVPYGVEAGTALSLLDEESLSDLSAPEPCPSDRVCRTGPRGPPSSPRGARKRSWLFNSSLEGTTQGLPFLCLTLSTERDAGRWTVRDAWAAVTVHHGGTTAST